MVAVEVRVLVGDSQSGSRCGRRKSARAPPPPLPCCVSADREDEANLVAAVYHPMVLQRLRVRRRRWWCAGTETVPCFPVTVCVWACAGHHGHTESALSCPRVCLGVCVCACVCAFVCLGVVDHGHPVSAVSCVCLGVVDHGHTVSAVSCVCLSVVNHGHTVSALLPV